VARKVRYRDPLQSVSAADKAGLAASPPPVHPFMWLARTTEILGPASSVSLVQHSLSVLHPRELHLEVFLVGPLAALLRLLTLLS
jgi:hypothetical protein